MAGIAAWKQFGDEEAPNVFAWWAIAAGAWILTGTGLRVAFGRQRDKETERSESPRDLSGCLHVLYQLLHKQCELEEADAVRVTLYRVVPKDEGNEEAEFLEQVVPYVGGGGGVGRQFSIKSGIIGRAYRTGDPFTARRRSDDYGEFIDELVEEWSYTAPEAKQHTEDRFAWMAIPLAGKGDEIIGIVYIDSKQKTLFSSEETKQLAIIGCFGIANYINERYK